MAIRVVLFQNRYDANDSKSRQTHTAINTMERRDKFIKNAPFLFASLVLPSGGKAICYLRKLLHRELFRAKVQWNTGIRKQRVYRTFFKRKAR